MISVAIAVVAVMSVQPTSENRTVLQVSGSPAWAGRRRDEHGARERRDIGVFHVQVPPMNVARVGIAAALTGT